MEYVYATLLLHAAGKKVDEAGLMGILKAAGVQIDEARAKAIVNALEGVNIDEAIKGAGIPAAVPVAAPAAPVKEEKKKVEEEKKEEEALAGLGALFG